MLTRFKGRYPQIITELQKEYGYTNVHQVPKLLKIVINMGLGKAISNSKIIDNAVNELALISGQKPILTKAKKSIAGFKLREGMNIGCKVTLRRDRMYEFLERLVIIALPRVKQFRGFSIKNFDHKSVLNFGIKEQIIFPEIKYDKVDAIRGMNISIVTSANSKQEAKSLLTKFDIPFYN